MTMIAEFGHYALVLALALALVQASVPMVGARTNDPVLMAVAGPTAVAQFCFIAIAFAALTMCYVRSDFSVVNVFENSHSAKPLIYKLSGVWGNHEGSMLLWVLILSLFGALVALFGGNLPARDRKSTRLNSSHANISTTLSLHDALPIFAFAALTMCYVRSDFSVVNVFENSHSAKPLIYKLSGVWGNHEGSMLLWVLILSLFGALVALFGGNLPA